MENYMALINSRAEFDTAEKNRRYTLLKNRLKDAGLSSLIVYGGTQLGVPVHYLSQIWGSKMNAVIFPVEGEPILLIPSNMALNASVLAEQGCWLPQENILATHNLSIGLAGVVRQLRLEKTRIGIDSFRFWPVHDCETFKNLCPKVELMECHRLFGEVRGPKSPAEMKVMKKAILISDMAHYAFLANLQSGMTETEAVMHANEVLDRHHVGDRIVLIHSRPEKVYPSQPTATIIQRPNPVIFSPEFTRKAGYAAQMIRVYAWEEPDDEYKRMFELYGEIRQLVMEEFRPGIEITTAAQKIESLVDAWGFECDKLGHAIGVAYGDVPYITAGPHQRDHMDWTILENEVYAVHPMIRNKSARPPLILVGDMFHIGKDETRWLTRTMPDLPVLIPW
jgi:Xaa-Pro aminopeptidase